MSECICDTFYVMVRKREGYTTAGLIVRRSMKKKTMIEQVQFPTIQTSIKLAFYLVSTKW